MAIADLGAKFEFEDAGAAERVEKLINVLGGLTDRVAGLENVVTGTSKEMGVLSGSINEVGKSLTSMYNQKVKKNLEGAVDAMDNTRKSLDKMGAQANRFVSSNIMAQFQDIFVSAQMGMKPFTIALQQGTQIMAAFAQSQAPLKDLIAGFKALIGPAAILTVTLTGLAASGIQMVDWMGLAKNVLNGLSSAFDFVAKNADKFGTAIVAVGTTMIAFNAKAILTTTSNLLYLGTTFLATAAKAAGAWVIALGPVGWVTAAILTLTATVVAFGDKIETAFKKAFDKLPDNVKFAITKAKNYFYDFVNETIGLTFALAYSIGGLIETAIKGAGIGYKEAWNQFKEQFNEIYHFDYLGVAGKGVEKTVEGIGTAATAVSDKFKEWSDNLGKSEEKSKKIKDYWADIVKNAEQSISSLKLEASLLGKSEFDQTYEKTLQNLKQQAEDRGIDLDPDKISQLEDLARRTAKVTEETNKLTEAYTESKSIFKGFFSDMRQGLLEGESAWESFGNAVLNVLNKIQEKLMDKTTDLLFDALWNVGSAYFSAPSTTGGSTAEVNRLGDLGASVGRKPIMAANGGVFSNGIYDSPTLFKFARGGRFGVMGEAGPEAVMPLTRGPDGSLGVKADGAGSSPVIVNVINNSNAQARTEQRQTSQGVELDVIIDNLVADKMNKNGSASNSALKAFSSQSLVMR